MTERATGRGKRADHDASHEGEAADRAPAAKAQKSKASQASKAAASSGFNKKTIALVYDFDGTLSPKPMQEYSFLPKLGIEAKAFWEECGRVAREQGADPLITYMHLMYKKAKEKNIRIDREDLVKQGQDVELFPGVDEWFGAIEEYVKIRSDTDDVVVRHYLVSSGLTEIIEGTRIRKHFHNVFASEYWFDAYDLPYPKRVITDTGKTQYLFRINKGIEDMGESINSHMPEEQRPIPFSNMIYFGDGETDVPSMALMRKSGGYAVAVHAPGGSAEKCIHLLQAGRIDFFAPADYQRGSDLFRRTCRIVDKMLAEISLHEEMWAFRKDIGA